MIRPQRRPMVAGAQTKAVEAPTVVVCEDGWIEVKDWEAYRVLAGVTESKPASWSKESTDNLRLVHMALGILTEVDELFPANNLPGLAADNYFEELGDMLWYIAGFQNILAANGIVTGQDLLSPSVSRATVTAEVLQDNYRSVRLDCVVIADLAKRILAYGNGSFPAESQVMALYYRCLNVVMASYVVVAASKADCPSLQLVGEGNINKLKKRYPEGFNPNDAIKRQLTVEAKILAEAAKRKSNSGVENVSVQAKHD